MPALVGLDAQKHEEMSGGAATRAGLALAGESQPHAVLDAGRNRDGQLLLAHDQPGAAPARAGILDHRAFAATGRARRRDHEEALRMHDLAAPAAGRAGDRTRAGLRTRAAAVVAPHAPLYLDFARHAAHGLV